MTSTKLKISLKIHCYKGYGTLCMYILGWGGGHCIENKYFIGKKSFKLGIYWTFNYKTIPFYETIKKPPKNTVRNQKGKTKFLCTYTMMS